MKLIIDHTCLLEKAANAVDGSAEARVRRHYSFVYWHMIFLMIAGMWITQLHAAPSIAPVSGEIQFISINNPGDHWSGGSITVGGTVVIIPRNLLIDLPANRLTLQQLYAQAPATCLAAGETGLAKGDTCNPTGMGGIANISANRTNGGNVIAGDVFIEKAAESVTGVVSYIDYNDGYFRLNGNAGDAATGVMVRLNDPSARHTVQQGLGCSTGPNCSADPRFMLDANNYVNVFTTGYPLCIPSTVSRTFVDVLGLGTTLAQSAADGSGDVLCPDTNRPAGGVSGTAADSRLFAPIQLGDHIVAKGNFESVNGTRFLSSHTTMVSVALTTNTAQANQPDYMFFNEVFMEAPGFQNQRMRNMFIGFTTVTPADVLVWSIHYDPVTNSVHELPLASTKGCDTAAGVSSCTGQGLALSGWDIFRIRYDVDFGIGAKPLLNPCAHLRAEPRFAFASPVCPNGPIDPVPVLGGGGKGGGGGAATAKFDLDITEMMGIMQPVAHEIQARTGRKLASLAVGGTPLITLDIMGADATNGQYLFPLGMNLGGLEVAEMSEIDLAKFASPLSFSGIPWNMDRRLSPGGCLGGCESTPQPLDPFPFENMDPRFQAPPVAGLFSGLPQGTYFDPNFTATLLTRASDRVLSYVNAAGIFNGNASVLAWPPIDPAGQVIDVTPDVTLMCFANPAAASTPIANNDTATTLEDTAVTIRVINGDTLNGWQINPSLIPVTLALVDNGLLGNAVVNSATGEITYTPNSNANGADSFTYTVTANGVTSNVATVIVNITPVNDAPIANPDSAADTINTPLAISVLANDTDVDGDVLSIAAGSVTVPVGPAGTTSSAIANANGTITFTGNGVGAYTFSYRATDGVASSSATQVTVTLNIVPPTAPTAITTMLNSTTSPTAIRVGWTDNANNETGFEIMMSTDSGAYVHYSYVASSAASGGLAAQWIPVTTGHTYSFSVTAYRTNAGFTTNSSALVSGVVDLAAPAAPAAPTAITTMLNSTTSPTAIRVGWTDNANNETGFEIMMSTDGGAYVHYSNMASSAASGGLAAQWIPVTTGHTYSFSVTAYRTNAGFTTNSSALVSGVVDLAAPAAPAAPTAITTMLNSTTSPTAIRVGWTDNANNETGFEIMMSTDGGAYVHYSNMASSAASGGLAAQWIPVTTGHTYSFSVTAYRTNAGFTTNSSALVSGVVDLAAPAAPAAPTAITTMLNSTTSPTAIRVGWTDNANNETGFEIMMSTDSGAYVHYSYVASSAASGGLAAQWISVTTGHTYSFSVTAYSTNAGLTTNSTPVLESSQVVL